MIQSVKSYDINTIEKFDTFPLEEYFIWNLKLVNISTGKEILTFEKCVYTLKTKPDRKTIEFLYKNYSEGKSLLFYVKKDMYEALMEVKRERDNWGEKEWECFLVFIWPFLSKNIRMLRVY